MEVDLGYCAVEIAGNSHENASQLHICIQISLAECTDLLSNGTKGLSS